MMGDVKKSYKKDFPIFDNNPELVFLDSGASAQKPAMVIDSMSDFLSHDYANIHRGSYDLSERSEELYFQSKEMVANLLGVKSSEVIYTYNATYGINLVAQSLIKSDFLKKGDVVLLGMWDHHSDILPWQVLAEMVGFKIEFIPFDKDSYDVDRNAFKKLYTDKVRVVACGHVSNVTGMIYDIKKMAGLLREDTFFLVDGSQSVPHFAIDVDDLGVDCLVFTGHKIMASSGLGVVILRKEWIKKLVPMIVGGGTVEDVSVDGYVLMGNTDKFEAGTPNIVSAVSLLAALKYIDSIGGMKQVWEHEQLMVREVLKKFEALSDDVELVGPREAEKRVGVFSFIVPKMSNYQRLGEIFAEHNIAVRCGGHCAYPLHKHLQRSGTCRMSLYLYNDFEDIEKFFGVLKSI